MGLTTMVCSGGRLGMRFSGTRIIPLASQRPQTRFLSLQHARSIPKSLVFQRVPNARSYWWSKSPAPVPEVSGTAEVASHEQPPVLEASPPPTPETVPESITSDSLAQSTATPVDGTRASETVFVAAPSSADAPDIPVIAPSADAIPPLQFGDLAELGLAGWTPAGIIRWSFELLNVSTGMPWFYTIIAGTLLWRVALFPASVISIRNSARLLPYSSQLMALTEDMKTVDRSDRLALQRLALKRQKIYEDAGVKVLPSIIMPFVQIPVTLGMFFGVKKLVQLPVEQLKESGVDILSNLTVPDPYYILPLITTAMINVQMQVMRKDVNFSERPEMAHIMNFMRAMTVLGIPFMGQLPSGLWLSVCTGVCATTLQTVALQQPAVRRALKIPPLVKQGTPPTMMQSFQYAKEYFAKRRDDAMAQQKIKQASASKASGKRRSR
ncbi:hypothetical protein BV22DRAFT_1060676 [Leucogyrophana mollusca]|uniref:Uncharacterized protein n=1 Tax=Leucogyrophana mollusca TaxID=85980 RepID=A0ACB8BPP8_9AGAM|nr:hypothetical protein BV22DRAFT_1060676 [Leucogyrophana mollusca]